MRIALVVGHSEQDGGAARVVDGVQEFEWNLELAEKIKSHDPGCFEIFTRKGWLPYREEIAEVYSRVDEWGAEASIEFHFNAVESPRATGAETFSSGSKGSLALAGAVQSAMVVSLGLRDRGVKIRNSRTGGRGYESLIAGQCPAILIEPYFGSNAADCKRADEKKDELAELIYRACVRWSA